MRSVFFLVLLSSFAIGCAKQGSKVSLKLSTSAIFGAIGGTLANYAQGGLMVWGMSADRVHAFGRVLVGTDQVDLELPNGQWTFYAMAWQNGDPTPPQMSSPSAAGVRCARSPLVALGGTPVSPELILTNANCQNEFFRGEAITAAGMAPELHFCETVAPIDNAFSNCTENRTMATHKADKVPVMSARIRLAEYARGSVGTSAGQGLSVCAAFNTDGVWATPGTVYLPMGSVANPLLSPFRTEIEYFFNSTNCNVGEEQVAPGRVVLANGFVNGKLDADKRYFHSTSPNRQKLYLQLTDQQLCQGRSGLGHFAAGTGSAGFPYLICSPHQLFRIHDGTPGRFSASYRLAIDVDLNPYSAKVTMPADISALVPDWQLGQNWVPIGSSVDSNGQAIPGGAYVGSFDGNNHVITNLRIRQESAESVGFIGRWESAPGQFVRDLHFVNPEVSADSMVGAAVGYAFATATSRISNLSVEKGEVEGRNQTSAMVGGVFGKVILAEVSQLRSRGTEVKSEGNYVGGIAGDAVNLSSAKDVFSSALVAARYPQASVGIIGGLFGRFESSSVVTDGLGSWAFEGAVIATGMEVGGLVGYYRLPASAQPLVGAYMSGLVSSRLNSNPRIGGLIGNYDSSEGIQKAYVSGIVFDGGCSSPCSRGHLVGYSAAPITGVSLYRVVGFVGGTPASGGDNGLSILTMTQADLLDSTFQATLFTNPPFVHPSGDQPRLLGERHPCAAADLEGQRNRMSLADQISAGRGSSGQPLRICSRSQFEQIPSLGSGRHVRLLSSVSRTQVAPSIAIPAGVVLDGDRFMIYGFAHTLGGGGLTIRPAPFSTIAGTLRGVFLPNHRFVLNSVGPGSFAAGVASVVAATGRVEDVHVVEGFVSNNTGINGGAVGLAVQNFGVIERSSFHAILGTSYNVFGLVERNEVGGVIRLSTAAGTFNIAGTAESIAGIARVNHGIIEQVTVTSHLDTFQDVSEVALMVLQNSAGAVLRDSRVGTSGRWSFNSVSGTYSLFARLNAGTMLRLVHAGYLHSKTTNTNTTGNTGTLVGTNSGAAQGLISLSGVGRRIMEGNLASITCSGDSIEFTGTGWNGTTSLAYDSAFWQSFNGGTRVAWVIGESDGRQGLWRIGSGAPGGIFTLAGGRTCADFLATAPTNMMLILSEANSVSLITGTTLTVAPFNQFISGLDLDPNMLRVIGSPWNGTFYDYAIAADQTALLNFYATMLANPLAVSPRPWEFDPPYGLDLLMVRD